MKPAPICDERGWSHNRAASAFFRWIVRHVARHQMVNRRSYGYAKKTFVIRIRQMELLQTRYLHRNAISLDLI